MKRLVLALAIISVPASAAPDRYGAIQTVAIRSELGDVIILKRDHDLFGSDAPDVVLHTGADLDGYVVAQISAAVAGRFRIVDAGQTADALIVVHPVSIVQNLDMPQFRASFSYSGISATRSTGLFGAHTILLSAQYAISVYDTATRQEIGYGKAVGPATGMFGRRPDPIEHCDDAFWPAALTDPGETQSRQIRADLMAIVASSLPNAIQNAGLGGEGTDTKLSVWDGQKLACEEFG